MLFGVILMMLELNKLSTIKYTNIKDLFIKNKVIYNVWLHVASPFGAEIIAHQGWDTVTIDMQHGLITDSDALSMLQAISSTSAQPMVRVSSNDPITITKCLDMGARGIITPMINTVEDVKIFIDSCLYPPDGKRSFGPIRAVYYEDEDYVSNCSDKILKIIQIESKKAFDNLDNILDVKHLDGIYIGPNDLALGLGTAEEIDKKNPQRANEFRITDDTMSAIDKILKKTLDCNLIAGIHSTSEKITSLMISKGFQLVTVTSDERLLASGSQLLLRNLKE